MIAREAKPLVLSAWAWGAGAKGVGRIWYEAIVKRALRVQDPFLALHGRWLLRRLAPLCSRIRLSDLPKQRDELRLLRAMGWETANVHLGGGGAAVAAISKNLSRQPWHWLHQAASAMAAAIGSDWEEWRKST